MNLGTNPIVKRPCQVDHTSRFGPQQILWIFGYAMLLEDAGPAVDRGRPVMGVTKRALTPWCLVLRCSKSRAEISTWALPLPVYVLYISIPHAGAPPRKPCYTATGADKGAPEVPRGAPCRGAVRCTSQSKVQTASILIEIPAGTWSKLNL